MDRSIQKIIQIIWYLEKKLNCKTLLPTAYLTGCKTVPLARLLD